jgi:hypothetical protein
MRDYYGPRDLVMALAAIVVAAVAVAAAIAYGVVLDGRWHELLEVLGW